jgi:hypothetical protein
MRATSKRLADVRPDDVILIDRAGHRAVVQRNAPDADPGLRARGCFQTAFLMNDGRDGGWTGHGDRPITVVTDGALVCEVCKTACTSQDELADCCPRDRVGGGA